MRLILSLGSPSANASGGVQSDAAAVPNIPVITVRRSICISSLSVCLSGQVADPTLVGIVGGKAGPGSLTAAAAAPAITSRRENSSTAFPFFDGREIRRLLAQVQNRSAASLRLARASLIHLFLF